MAQKDTITTKFKVDISDLKKGISEANNQIKLANAQFKAASSGMDNWAKSSDGINAKLKQLGTLLDQEKIKLKNYQLQIKQLEESETENGKRVDELKNKLKQLVEQGVSKTSEEYKKYKTALNDCEKEQISNQKQIDKLRITMTNQQGTVNGLEKDIKNYNVSLENLDKNQEEVNNSIQKMSDGFTVAKGVLANFITDGIRKAIDGIKDLTIAAIEYESSFTNVKKTVDGTDEQLEQLNKDIRNMAKEMPQSASAIAEVASVAGQLGIKTDDVANFTKTMIMLGDSTNLSSDEASSALAKFANVVGMSADNYSKLGSTIVALGNNFATTEQDIVNMGTKLASAGHQVGMSESEIMSFATALSSVGMEAEAGGTAFSKLMINMQVATETGGDNLKQFADVAGMTSEEFKKAFQINAAGAIQKFIAGLSDTEKNGKTAVGVLTDMGITEVRLRDSILRAVGAKNVFNEAVELGNKAWNEDIALTHEAEQRYNTTASKIDIIKNNITELGLTLFDKLKPSINEALDSLINFTSKINWDNFGKKVKKSFDKVLDGFEWLLKHRNEVVTALKVMIAAFAISKINQWTKSMSKIATSFLTLITNTKLSTTALNTNTIAQKSNTTAQLAGTTATKGLTVAQNLLNAAWKANPIGLIITGVTAVIALYQKFRGQSEQLTEAQEREKELLKEQTDKINENRDAWDELKESKQQEIDAGMTELSHYQSLYDELTNLVDANGKVKEGYEERASFIVSTLNDALGTEITLTDGVIQKYDSLKDSIQQVIDKKKAQIILESQEDLYREAINKQSEAVKTLRDAENELGIAQAHRSELEEQYNKIKNEWLNTIDRQQKTNYYQEMLRIDQLIKKQDEEVVNYQKNYDKQKSVLEEYYYNIGLYEQNAVLAHEGRYNEMSTVTWNLVKDYQAAGEAEKIALEEQITNEEKNLTLLKELKFKTGSEIYDQQIKDAEKQLLNLKENLKKYNDTTDSGLTTIGTTWNRKLGEQLSSIIGKNIEFKNSGNDLVQMYADGVELGEPQAKEKMKNLVDNSIKEITNKKGNAKTAGENLLDGLNSGITNQDKQNSIFSSIASFGAKLLSKLRSALEEHSPSKATNEMGQYLVKGLEIGIKKQENPILKQVKQFGEDIINTLNSQLDVKLNTNFKDSLNSIKNSLDLSTSDIKTNTGSINNNSKTISNINNYTQNIYSPKTPSRIELYRQTRNLLNYKKREG